jgi:hypothetical protein
MIALAVVLHALVSSLTHLLPAGQPRSFLVVLIFQLNGSGYPRLLIPTHLGQPVIPGLARTRVVAQHFQISSLLVATDFRWSVEKSNESAGTIFMSTHIDGLASAPLPNVSEIACLGKKVMYGAAWIVL